ncbi:hypothetical protein F511_27345 [Dorcoceras hygrometricum]|uniref:Uncharacterized protein n=1 Tax=Dorcoceras hygrometricum TaxID=472368 RepID=A0A2Z7BBT6_9LAMI|nr:hypothetical protein F511_27345 [Dorcoceras hygrometricum]
MCSYEVVDPSEVEEGEISVSGALMILYVQEQRAIAAQKTNKSSMDTISIIDGGNEFRWQQRRRRRRVATAAARRWEEEAIRKGRGELRETCQHNLMNQPNNASRFNCISRFHQSRATVT